VGGEEGRKEGRRGEGRSGAGRKEGRPHCKCKGPEVGVNSREEQESAAWLESVGERQRNGEEVTSQVS
jgi:hypothetical protein